MRDTWGGGNGRSANSGNSQGGNVTGGDGPEFVIPGTWQGEVNSGRNGGGNSGRENYAHSLRENMTQGTVPPAFGGEGQSSTVNSNDERNAVTTGGEGQAPSLLPFMWRYGDERGSVMAGRNAEQASTAGSVKQMSSMVGNAGETAMPAGNAEQAPPTLAFAQHRRSNGNILRGSAGRDSETRRAGRNPEGGQAERIREAERAEADRRRKIDRITEKLQRGLIRSAAIAGVVLVCVGAATLEKRCAKGRSNEYAISAETENNNFEEIKEATHIEFLTDVNARSDTAVNRSSIDNLVGKFAAGTEFDVDGLYCYNDADKQHLAYGAYPDNGWWIGVKITDLPGEVADSLDLETLRWNQGKNKDGSEDDELIVWVNRGDKDEDGPYLRYETDDAE